MPDLTLSRITQNAAAIIDRINTFQLNTSMIEGRNALITALSQANYTADVFLNPNLPHFALMAYQHDFITEAQLTTTILYWEALSDYPAEHMQKLAIHRITQDDHSVLHELAPFLQLQVLESITTGKTCLFQDKLDCSIIERILTQLLAENTPASERCFMTFEINAKEPQAEMFHGLNSIGFRLFVPIKKERTFKVLLPSFTLIQITLSGLSPHPVQLIPRLGKDTSEDIYHMHTADSHPFGLSYPGWVEHHEADDFKTGRFGFSIHDIYHAASRAFTLHRPLFDDFILLAQTIHAECTDAHRFDFQDAVEILIDNQFRNYMAPQLLIPSQIEQLWLTKDAAIFVAFSAIFIKHSMQLEDLQEINKRLECPTTLSNLSKFNRLIKGQQKLIALNPAESLRIKKTFCHLFIEKLFKQNGNLQHEHLDLAHLIDIILQDEWFSSKHPALLSKTEQRTLDLRMDVRQLFLAFLSQSTKQTEHPWLATYYRYTQSLQSCITSHDIERLKTLLRDKTYTSHIAHLDRIYGVSPTLIEQAAELNQLDALQLLHTTGAQLTPLMLRSAAKHRNVEMMKFLLDSGLNAYTIDKNRRSVIDDCLQQDSLELMKLLFRYISISQIHFDFLKDTGVEIHPNYLPLLDRYASFRRTLFTIAHTHQRESRLRLLSELVKTNHDDFNFNTCVESDPSGKRNLGVEKEEYAYGGMHASFVSLLKTPEELNILRAYQTIHFDIRDPHGQTVLHTLCNAPTINSESVAYIQTILTCGVNIDATNHQQETALMLAIKQGHINIAEILISHGASLNMAHHQMYFTEILLAKFERRAPWEIRDEQRLHFLLRHGFDLNLKFAFTLPTHTTPVEQQAQSIWTILRSYNTKGIGCSAKALPQNRFNFFWGQLNPVSVLSARYRILCIEHGANLNELSALGELELNVAINNGWHDYLHFLLKRGANPNLVDQQGNSPLHIAARLSNEKVMHLLCQHGARSFYNRQHETPEAILESQQQTNASAMS